MELRSGHRVPSSLGPAGTILLLPCRQLSSQRDGERYVPSARNVGSYYCWWGKTNGWNETGTRNQLLYWGRSRTRSTGSQEPLFTCTSIHSSISSILSIQPSSHLFFQSSIHSMDISSYHPTIIYPPSTPFSFHPYIHLVIHSTIHSSKECLLSIVLVTRNAVGTREMWSLPSWGLQSYRGDRQQVIIYKYKSEWHFC